MSIEKEKTMKTTSRKTLTKERAKIVKNEAKKMWFGLHWLAKNQH